MKLAPDYTLDPAQERYLRKHNSEPSWRDMIMLALFILSSSFWCLLATSVAAGIVYALYSVFPAFAVAVLKIAATVIVAIIIGVSVLVVRRRNAQTQ